MSDRTVLDRPTSPQLGWGRFAAWLLLGVGYSFAVLGAMTIGVLILPVVIVGTLLVRPRAKGGTVGLLSGLGLPFLYVAFLNRDGPGTVCVALRGGGQRCSDEFSPWPWLIIGFALVVVGVLIFRVRRRLPLAQ
jgi:hypothetical protein